MIELIVLLKKGAKMNKIWLGCGVIVALSLSACTQYNQMKELMHSKDEYVFCVHQNARNLEKCEHLKLAYEANLSTSDTLR